MSDRTDTLAAATPKPENSITIGVVRQMAFSGFECPVEIVRFGKPKRFFGFRELMKPISGTFRKWPALPSPSPLRLRRYWVSGGK